MADKIKYIYRAHTSHKTTYKEVGIQGRSWGVGGGGGVEGKGGDWPETNLLSSYSLGIIICK